MSWIERATTPPHLRAGCRHDDDYECMAGQIAVGHASRTVCCLSYQPRASP